MCPIKQYANHPAPLAAAAKPLPALRPCAGDSEQDDVENLENVDIICTTPEKFGERSGFPAFALLKRRRRRRGPGMGNRVCLPFLSCCKSQPTMCIFHCHVYYYVISYRCNDQGPQEPQRDGLFQRGTAAFLGLH